MLNKGKINKFMSGVLVAPMVLGISNQVFENFKIFASAGVLDEDYIPEENLVEIDEDYYNAEELNEENIDENGLKYELNGEEATVEKCTDKEIEGITIPILVRKGGKVYKVTKIGDSAFEGCSGLTGELKIPESVTSIGNSAFRGCSGLTGELKIPSGVREIDYCAFAFCSGLTGELKIPDSVTSIGDNAFWNCSGLTSVKIPGSVERIGRCAFKLCKNVTIESDIVHQADDGLIYVLNKKDKTAQLNSVLNIEIEKANILANVKKDGKVYTVTEIGDYAFEGCSGLTSVKIPGSVERIERCAFRGCKKVTIESDIVHQTDDGLIYVLNKKDKTAQLNSVLNIEIEKANILANVKKDGKVYTVTEIGECAFFGCRSLTGVEIPGSVTSIGWCAFARCSGLTKIRVPKGAEIGKDAFSSGVEIEEYEDYYNAEELNEENIDENGLKYELNGEEATVEKCTDKEIEGITIPILVRKGGKVYKVTKIGWYAFCGCSGLTGELKIPSGVTEIGDYAFRGCSGLTGELKIPDSVTYIGSSAFAYCSGLTGELKIPGSVTYIGNYAFYGCSGLTSVKIPGSVERIGRCAFKLCKNVTIESDIVHQADDGLIYVLNKKDKTAQLNSVLNIEIEKANILANVKKDGKVYTVTEIGANAFRGCSGLTSVKIPGSVERIGRCAFKLCKNVTIESDIVHQADDGLIYVLNKKDKTAQLNSVLNIEIEKANILANVKKDGKVYTVTEIGANAFKGCSGLTKIRVPKGAEIDKDAFSSGVEIEEYEVEAKECEVETRECEVEENNCCRI